MTLEPIHLLPEVKCNIVSIRNLVPEFRR